MVVMIPVWVAASRGSSAAASRHEPTAVGLWGGPAGPQPALWPAPIFPGNRKPAGGPAAAQRDRPTNPPSAFIRGFIPSLQDEITGDDFVVALELQPAAIEPRLREAHQERQGAIASGLRLALVGMRMNESNTVLVDQEQMAHRPEVRVEI